MTTGQGFGNESFVFYERLLSATDSAITVANGAGMPLKGVTVKFAGSKAKTGANGRAKIAFRPTKAGRLTATAASAPLKSGKAVVQVSR